MGNPFWIVPSPVSKRQHILPLILLLLSVIVLKPEPARAGDAETASAAVDLFVQGSQFAGLPITATEAEVVKQIVTCGLNGTAIGGCVRNMAVAVALKELGTGSDLSNATTCLISGKPAVTCVNQAVVAQLPAEARPMVSCMMAGQGNVADCSKKFVEGMIIDKVPAELRPAAACIIETGDAANCSKDLIIQQVMSRLPPDLRDQANTIVNCLGGSNPSACVASAAAPEQIEPLVACATAANANVGQCMADFAAKELPDGVAKNMVGCIGAGADFGKCAAQKGITSAEDLAKSQISTAQQDAIQKALDTIDKLRPDADYTIEAGPNKPATIKNIMMVADGIKTHDWSKVVRGAGPELAKIASSILLSIFLTPALAGVLSPAVEAMINNDVAAANRALDAMSKGDAVGLTQVAFEWYENSFIDKPCALVGDSKARDTICGGLSDAIKFISKSGGDLAKALLGAGKDVLEWIGVWGTIDDVATFGWNTLKGAVTEVGHFLGIGSDEWKPPADCASPARESPSDYLANHFLTCLPKTAASAVAGRSADTAKLTADCNAYFNRCTDPKKRGAVAAACSAMTASLSNLTGQVSNGIAVAAQAYADAGIGMASIASDAYKDWQSNLEDLCAANFWQNHENVYAQKCAAFVDASFPLGPASGLNVCSAVPSNSAASRQACIAALRAAPAAKKGAMAGPNSDFCKKQKEWIAAHPCTVEKAGAPIPIPGGGQLPDIKVDCGPSYRMTPLDKATGPSLEQLQSKTPQKLKTVRPSRPGDEVLRPSSLKDKQQKASGSGNSGPVRINRSAMDTLGDTISENGLNNVVGNAGGPSLSRIPSSRITPSGVRVQPPPGGSGGIGLVNGGSGNAPVPKGKSQASTSGGSGGIGLVNGASGNAPINSKSKPVSSSSKTSPAPDLDMGGCSSCNRKDDINVR